MSDRDKLDALRRFAQRMMESWPEGDVDGGHLQDMALACGLLAAVKPAPTEPCGEYCPCAEYYGECEWAAGVECYRPTPLLTGEGE